jgi:hypothetical protein
MGIKEVLHRTKHLGWAPRPHTAGEFSAAFASWHNFEKSSSLIVGLVAPSIRHSLALVRGAFVRTNFIFRRNRVGPFAEPELHGLYL